MNDINLQSKMTELLGLEAMNEAEQANMLLQIGDSVIESTLIRFLRELDDKQTEAVEYYLEDQSNGQITFTHLFESYPRFKEIFEEEVRALKDEAELLLSMPETTSS